MVAILALELAQVPVYGTTKGTGAREGALLNVPIEVNCT